MAEDSCYSSMTNSPTASVPLPSDPSAAHSLKSRASLADTPTVHPHDQETQSMHEPRRDHGTIRLRRLAALLAVGLVAACSGPVAGAVQDAVAGHADSEAAAPSDDAAAYRVLGGPLLHKSANTTMTRPTSVPTTTELGKALERGPAKTVLLTPDPEPTIPEAQASRYRRATTSTAAQQTKATTTTVKQAATATTTTAAPKPATPTVPVPTGVLVSVADHGAIANDSGDDQAAIQEAIDSAPPGSTVVFPPGTYVHSDYLTVHTQGVKLFGYGATLVATNPSRHALILRADNTEVSGFTLIGSPTVRMNAEEQMGIALHYTNGSTVRDNVVRGTSSAGIFVWGSSNYAVRNNTVENTMSDGIHSVGGSSYGIVEGNTLRNVGDDCFAVVSYIAERAISNHITIRNNSCVGGKARGVSVVGGSDVLIQGNTIEASGAAGIYLASEPSYNTYAAKRVTVVGNTLRGVNVNPNIRHGAVFIWGRAGSATTADGATSTLQNEDLLIQGNTIIDTVGGTAHIVAQGSDSYRVNIVSNVTQGSLRHSYIEMAGDQYNLVHETHNGAAVDDHVGNASILP